MSSDSRNFAAFILTHGRPDNVRTVRSLEKSGYTGPLYFVVDNEDPAVDRYRQNFGPERVVVFDKKAMADATDEGNNFDNRKVIVHARNACFDIADRLDITHFIQLDDDYTQFKFRYLDGWREVRDLNRVFDTLVDFFVRTPIHSIAISQGGDHIGGFAGVMLKRKCMNSFICSPARRFRFLGSINEDVNTYTLGASRGELFFTFTGLQLDQVQTQGQAGGMTDVYLERGTYVKSFSTVLYSPSCVSVSMLRGQSARRLHHAVKWSSAVPKIVPSHFQKEC